MDDGYALVVGSDEGDAAAAPADPDDLVALAIAYFAEELPEPSRPSPRHGDIGALVRHVAERATDAARVRQLAEAVDAVDDGLAADVVVGRLSRCLEGDEEPVARLRRRAAEVLA